MRGLFFLFCATSFLFAEPVEKAAKYHELLLKNTDNETLMTRFLEAWLDEQDRDALEKWLDSEAENGGAAERRILARYLDHIGAQERALKQFKEALKLEPENTKTGVAVARLQAAGMDFEGALKTLGAREDVEAVTLRGAYEHRLGKTEAAMELWKDLLKKKPADRELREDLISLFRQEGLGKEAQELQKELIALGDDPFQRALDQLSLGDLELENGLKEAALASYREVLTASGSGSWLERESLHKMHEIFRRERDANGLGEFLAKLREEMPHRLALQKSFARQQVVTGAVDEGVAAFREIIRRTPGDETMQMEFVELLAFAEKYEESAEELEALIKGGATAERWLRLAELKLQIDDKEALKALVEMEALKGTDAAGILEMARTYARFDLDDEALRVLKGGQKKEPDSREISEALAVLLVELERKDEALTIWRTMAKEGQADDVIRVAESLRRNGLGPEAFDLMAEHRGMIEGHFVGLSLSTELAMEAENFELAWTGVRELIALPEAFSDLQLAVNLGSVVGRKYGLEKAILELEKLEGENARCLLAMLQQMAGQLPEADATIAKLEGELARRYRVVLLTSRGDYSGAVAHLRKMMDKRVSLAQRMQLLDLLERQRDFAGALGEAEQWKISSPGEVRAWKKRASLLTQLGRHQEAADELRRARNLFGRDDVELTRGLAQKQLPLGRHREALRLYEHLFRTAKTDEARLKCLDEMYAAASQAGLQNEMIARFEREHEEAERELFPLRSLARLFQLASEHGARQEVLLKLHRLLPDDEKVLFELVALAEQNRDLAGAKQLLMEHAARTHSVGTLQRVAAMEIKAGEVEAGLEILNGITPGKLNAGDVEAMAVQLWGLKEHQLALEFLETNEAIMNADWRLIFIHANFLEKVGRVDEARKIWTKLLKAEGALTRPMPPNHYRTVHIPGTGQVLQWHWWQLLRGDRYQQNNLSLIKNLPTDAHEVRWLSLARLARASLRDDPSGKSWQAFLETQSQPWLAKVREWGISPQTSVPTSTVKQEIKMTPEMRLQNLVNEPKTSREEFLKLAAEVEEKKPALSNSSRIHGAFKLPDGAEQLTTLREIAARISEEDLGGNMNAGLLTRLVIPQFRFDLFCALREKQPSPEQKEKLKQLEPWWQSQIKQAITKAPGGTNGQDLLFPLSVQHLTGDRQGFLENLDRLLGAKLIAQQTPGWGQIQPQTSHYLNPLEGLPERNSLLSSLGTQHVIYRFVSQGTVPRLISPELLKKAREQGWETRSNEKVEEFAKGIPQLKDGLLRALLYRKIGFEEKFLTEMDLLGSEGKLEDKLNALACRHVLGAPSENEVVLAALLAMDRSDLDPTEVNLLDDVTIGEARKNRQIANLDEEKKAALREILKRYAATPKGLAMASTVQHLNRPLGLATAAPKLRNQISRNPYDRRQSYRQLLNATSNVAPRKRASEQEQIEESFLEQLKHSFASGNVGRNLKPLIKTDQYRGLKNKALAVYHPGDSRSYLKRIRYAHLCLAYDEREKAREVLTQLKEERPYDSELPALIFLAQEPEEQTALLKELLRNGTISEAISSAGVLAMEAEDEEAFFTPFEKLVELMQNRADEFSPQNSNEIFRAFQQFQNLSRDFEKRSLHPITVRLPRVEKDEDSKEGDWALRVRQRKIIIAACVEMMRLRSIRGQVIRHVLKSQEFLRLDDGNVQWMVFDMLSKEPVTETEQKNGNPNGALIFPNSNYLPVQQDDFGRLVLKAIQNAPKFSDESVDQLLHHAFLSKEQGALVKAALADDAVAVKKLLAENQEKNDGKFRTQWADLLETLLRSGRWEDPVRESLKEAMAELRLESELRKMELRRICELGSLVESLATLKETAATHFPAAAMHESYDELQAAGAVPTAIGKKIEAGRALFQSLQNVPRAWIPLLTFLNESDLAVWVKMDEQEIRSQLQKRLNVMYKNVFYDRLRQEGFGSYDGLALLGTERITDSGEVSSWLEKLIDPLELSPTEGRTYWLTVSEDCRKQVEKITYLEAFIAMRKDFKIDEKERKNLLRSVLESDLEVLSKLGDNPLRGLANLLAKDFPKLQVPEASAELEELLKRLRTFPAKGVIDRIQNVMMSGKRLAALTDDEAKGLCTRLANEGEVERAAEFWVAYLKTKTDERRHGKLSPLNFELIARKPFMGSLDLLDSVRFVRLVRVALQERPELAESITYNRDLLKWREAFSPFTGYNKSPTGVVPFLEKILQRDGVAEVDKRVMGGFLIKANLSGRDPQVPHEAFRQQLEKSSLAEHSPGIVETMLALSQLQSTREKEKDLQALKVLGSYLRDQELMPDFRADLAERMIEEFKNKKALRELVDAKPVGVAMRDLLLRGSYGVTGNLRAAGQMLDFINQHLATVPAELQREIYEAWAGALEKNARAVLSENVGHNNRLRLLDILFDFTDAGKRFPLPPQMIAELRTSFSGDLKIIQKLIRSGNDDLIPELMPEGHQGFRLPKNEYSVATWELENDVLPVIPADFQVLLKCYLANLEDAHDWKAAKKSKGQLQTDRMLAAARLFAANPPQEQATRLSAIKHFVRSNEALEVIVPLFSDELKDDLPSVAQNHRGDFSHMLRWVKAGGAETIAAFAPTVNRPLRIYRLGAYRKELAELENLLTPLLNEAEKIRLTCDLAVLPDPSAEDHEANDFPRRDTRMEEAANFILKNRMPDADREAEKKGIAQLMKAGLSGPLAGLLMQKDLLDVDQLNAASLAAMSSGDAELLAYQLRTMIAKGDTAAALTCLEILGDDEAELSNKSRAELMSIILPKIAVPLIAHATRQGAGNDGKELLTRLKTRGTKFFELTFGKDQGASLELQQSAVFFAFATHCLTDDKEGFEALQKTATSRGRRNLVSLTSNRNSASRQMRAVIVQPAALPVFFDGNRYLSDDFKPLRMLLFAKIREHSFTGLPPGNNDPSEISLMKSLGLTLNGIDLGEEALASERGSLSSIASAVLSGDDALFLALLPTNEEIYFRKLPMQPGRNHFDHQRRMDQLRYQLERHWSANGWTEDLNLIKDDFQRLHFEIYFQSVMSFLKTEGARYDLKILTPKTREKISELLPKAGPAREQVLAYLAAEIEPGSKLARALSEQANAKEFGLEKVGGRLAPIKRNERFTVFNFSWLAALQAGDWSVLDHQLQFDASAPMTEFLTQCAGVQALSQVAGDAGMHEDVLKKFEAYRSKKSGSTSDAWIELIGLVAGAKTSNWKDTWQTLDADQQELARAEMAKELTEILGQLSRVRTPRGYDYVDSRSRSSRRRALWLQPSAREKSAQILAAIMNDDLGLFSTAGISAEERAKLMIKSMDWQQMKTWIEKHFEGELQAKLLTELALNGRMLDASMTDFQTFVEMIASQIAPDLPEASKLWLKLARLHISTENLAGAISAREKINPSHLQDHELSSVNYSIKRLEVKPE